ncbi:MAG: hypothetical protein ACRDT4_13620 [Micromonosporaceae bacterium]
MPHVRATRIQPRTTPEPRRRRTWTVVTLVVVTLSAAGAGSLLYAGLPDPDQEHAIVACRTEVDKRLLAPATAEYSDETFERGERDTTSPLYYVTGSVDAENRFGARLRASYLCTAAKTADGWAVLHLELDEPEAGFLRNSPSPSPPY